nr:4-hydroxy-tetrahydrodipicolinate synthase [uncultured Marinifilum sp.]
MNNKKFTGTGVAIITPFNTDKSVDYKSLEQLVNFQIDNGVDYLVVLGTTGEAATLTKLEKLKVIELVCKTNAKRVPIVIGFGGNNTSQIIEQINEFDNFSEIDAILSVAPYYNKPSQEGIFQHYKLIAEASPVPIIIYNVPGRTSVNINADTVIRIANKIENVIAIKEASGDMQQIMQIIKNKPADFMLISGDDALTFPMIQLGASGVISVIGNAFPKEFSEMVRNALSGFNKKALASHYLLYDIIQNIFTEGNPAGIKAILHQKSLIKNELRLPLTPVSESHYTKIKKLSLKI